MPDATKPMPKKKQPDHSIDDPLGLLDPELSVGSFADPDPLPIPTGLSDEDDAGRWLALKFHAVMCWNCESVYEPDVGTFCPRCHLHLLPVADAREKVKRKKLPGA